MLINQMIVGTMDVFCYILACEKTKKAVIIDPGGDEDKILSFLKENNYELLYIINTHFHYDHITGNEKIQQETGAQIVMHEKDFSLMNQKETQDFFQGRSMPADNSPGDEKTHLVKDGDRINFGEESLEVINTPGHSPGGICLYQEGHLFTGDTLFVGAAGRTDLPGGDDNELTISIKEKIGSLPDDTKVWPGHDYGDTPTSTIEREKKENPFF